MKEKKHHQGRQHPFPFAEAEFVLALPPKDGKGQKRGNKWPAAAGMGKPLNSLFASAELAAARQLKRASRKAPQMRYTEATTHARAPETRCNTMRYTMSAGATPKETISAMESNSRPKSLSCPPRRASRPSSKSQMHAPRMHQMAKWKSYAGRASAGSRFPLLHGRPFQHFEDRPANPKQRFSAVIKFGSR